MTTLTTIRSPLFWLFLGALCYYAALPPLNIAALVLAVPICWGIVIRRPASPHPNPLPEREGTVKNVRPKEPARWYWVFLAAFLFWLASIWWIACPHPLTALGLLAMSAVLSLYWVLFFVATRVAVHRFRIPLPIAMPICWIGTEYLRCRILGGFSFCALEHAFYLYPPLIQFASIGGSLLVGGIIMFIGAAFVTCFYIPKLRNKIGYIVFFGIPSLFFLTIGWVFIWGHGIGYSYFADDIAINVVALQGNRQVYLSDGPKEANENFRQFMDLTGQAISERREKGEPMPDLIVFPETVCPIPVLVFEGTVTPADVGLTEDEATEWERWYRHFVEQIDTPVIFGLSTFVFKDDPAKPMRLNSALLVQPSQGDAPGNIYRYDKMHLVMFGEYIPFAEYLPDDFFLRSICPEAHHGNTPIAFPLVSRSIGQVGRRPPGGGTTTGQGSDENKTVMASVNICFESTIAHLIRSQVLTLRKQGHDPRVLINISNDGWFRFSQQIEQHLATHVFRAVENRMWYVAATNGGYSAIISPTGEIVSIGERGAAEPVGGDIWFWTDEEQVLTFYQRYGDWYALVFALIVLGLVVFALVERHRVRRVSKAKNNGAGE